MLACWHWLVSLSINNHSVWCNHFLCCYGNSGDMCIKVSLFFTELNGWRGCKELPLLFIGYDAAASNNFVTFQNRLLLFVKTSATQWTPLRRHCLKMCAVIPKLKWLSCLAPLCQGQLFTSPLTVAVRNSYKHFTLSKPSTLTCKKNPS